MIRRAAEIAGPCACIPFCSSYRRFRERQVVPGDGRPAARSRPGLARTHASSRRATSAGVGRSTRHADPTGRSFVFPVDLICISACKGCDL